MDTAFYPSLSIKSPKLIFGVARHARIGFSGSTDVTGAMAAALSGEIVSGNRSTLFYGMMDADLTNG